LRRLHAARTLADLPDLKEYVEVPRMAQLCSERLRDILHAVVAGDIAARDHRVDCVYHQLFDAWFRRHTCARRPSGGENAMTGSASLSRNAAQDAPHGRREARQWPG